MKEEEKQLLNEVKAAIPEEKKWSLITAIVLGAFCFVWFLAFINVIPTDYNIFFLVLSLITGFYWFKERKIWKPYLKRTSKNDLVRPWWLSWTAGIFQIVLFVFIVRGFLVEPFKVPTGSMIPNIMIGEVTLTNKMYYDFKIPVIEKSLFKIRDIKRGDVVVFRYPPNPVIYYVKRFIGLPGDKIEYDYESKLLSINGQKIQKTVVTTLQTADKEVVEYNEDLLGVKHSIWIEPTVNNIPDPQKTVFPLSNNCEYTYQKMKCTVPKGYYFAMGDNRDNSADSRYWGFVPHDNVIGKAQVIAFSPVEFKRIGWIK